MATHQLWQALPPAFSNEILVEVQKTNKKLYRTATELMAQQMRLRVPIVLEMPKVERHAHWARILAYPQMEVLSFNILSSWLIESQRPMLCAWLDSLGIEHGENGCADSFPPEPTSDLLKTSVDVLLAKFDPLLVTVYLRCFNQIDEVQWNGLTSILETDTRLFLPVSQPASAS